MWKFAQTLSQITFALLAHSVLVQPIIVERNYHAYYRLPFWLPTAVDGAQQFHILQCPHKFTTDIPTPKNMQICIVVGKYAEQELSRSGDTNRTATPTGRPLHTKVSFTLKSKNPLRPTKKTNIRQKTPYMIVIRPVRQNSNCGPHAARLRQRRMPAAALKRQPTATIRQIVDQSVGSTKAKHLRYMTAGKATRTTATIAAPLTEAPQVRHQHDDESAASSNESDYDDSTEDYVEPQMRPDTVLKYLNAKAAINQLLERTLSPRKADANHSAEAEAFFAENKDHRRGEKVHGYQNYYHRDEIFNDHIFYDELQQRGRYRSNGTQHEQY